MYGNEEIQDELISITELYKDYERQLMELADEYEAVMNGYSELCFYDCLDELTEIENNFEELEVDYENKYSDLEEEFYERDTEDEFDEAFACYQQAREDCLSMINDVHQTMLDESYT